MAASEAEFQIATKFALMFYGTEIEAEALETLLRLRFPALSDEEITILVREATTE
jgi:hypothetical protein